MLRPANFSLEAIDNCAFAGYAEAESWNGWARPFFSFEMAHQITDALSEFQVAFYDTSIDAFVFEVEDEEPEIYGAVTVQGIGNLYPIGAGNWIWEEVPESN